MVQDYHMHRKIGRNKMMFGDGELDGESSLMVSTFRLTILVAERREGDIKVRVRFKKVLQATHLRKQVRC